MSIVTDRTVTSSPPKNADSLRWVEICSVWWVECVHKVWSKSSENQKRKKKKKKFLSGNRTFDLPTRRFWCHSPQQLLYVISHHLTTVYHSRCTRQYHHTIGIHHNRWVNDDRGDCDRVNEAHWMRPSLPLIHLSSHSMATQHHHHHHWTYTDRSRTFTVSSRRVYHTRMCRWITHTRENDSLVWLTHSPTPLLIFIFRLPQVGTPLTAALIRASHLHHLITAMRMVWFWGHLVQKWPRTRPKTCSVMMARRRSVIDPDVDSVCNWDSNEPLEVHWHLTSSLLIIIPVPNRSISDEWCASLDGL